MQMNEHPNHSSQAAAQSTQRCPSEDRLRSLQCGNLSAEATEAVIAHVDECPRCQANIESLETGSPTAAEAVIPLAELPRTEVDQDRQNDLVRRLLVRRPSKDSDEPDLPDRVDGYAIIRHIATGGMGSVYEARHLHLGRNVALKWLSRSRAASREVAGRVLREWRAHGRLFHPGIVVATDAGLFRGRPYLVMELVDGVNLSTLVRDAGPLRIVDAVAISAAVAEAIDHAHGQQISHGDIKPSNVMLDRQGQVKVLDLGTAVFHGSAQRPTEMFGTPGYLAPERTMSPRSSVTPTASQTNDEDRDNIRADLYSFGCTLHFILTGRPPFGPAPWATTERHRSANLTPVQATETAPPIEFGDHQGSPDSAAAIQSVIDRLLEPSPEHRPETMQWVAGRLRKIEERSSETADLAKLVSDLPPVSTAVDNSGQTVGVTQLLFVDRPNHSRRRWFGAAMLLIGVLGALAWWTSRGNEDAVEALSSGGIGRNIERTIVDAAPAASLPKPAIEASQTQPVTRYSRSQPPAGFLFFSDAYAAMLEYRPMDNHEFLSQSEGLKRRVQAAVPDVRNVLLTSVAPRDGCQQIRWSPDGSRLAVLSDRYRIRLYDFDGHHLSLRFMTRGSTEAAFANCIAFDPRDQSLVAASSEFIGHLHFGPDGTYRVNTYPLAVGGIESISPVVVGQRMLLLVLVSGRLHGLDPDSDEVLTLDFDGPVLGCEASRDGSAAFVLVRDALHRLTAEWVASEDGSGVAEESSGRWEIRRQTVPGDFGSVVSTTAPNGDDDDRSASLRDVDLVRSLNADEAVVQSGKVLRWIDFSRGRTRERVCPPDASFQCRWETQDDDYTVIAHDHSLEVFRWLGGVKDFQPTKVFQSPAMQMLHPHAAVHPAGSHMAVTWRGRLELWDSRWRVAESLPALAPLKEVLPLPSGHGFGFFRHDGSGCLLDRDGHGLTAPLSRLPDPKHEDDEDPVGVVTSNYLDPVRGRWIQLRDDDRQAMVRSLPPLRDAPQAPPLVVCGVPSVETVRRVTHAEDVLSEALPERQKLFVWPSGEPNSSIDGHDAKMTDWVADRAHVLPAWSIRDHRISVHKTLPRLFNLSTRGHYVLQQLTGGEVRMISEGKVLEVERFPVARLSRDGRTGFVLSHTPQSVQAASVDLVNHQLHWRQSTDRIAGMCQLAIGQDGHPIAVSESGWVRFDAETGTPTLLDDPRFEHGIRHDRTAQLWTGDVFSSISRTTYIQPGVIWDPQTLVPRNYVFAAGPNDWVTLSPDGEVVEVIDGPAAPDRYVRDDPASPWQVVESVAEQNHSPADSLTVLVEHSGDESRQTFVPVNFDQALKTK